MASFRLAVAILSIFSLTAATTIPLSSSNCNAFYQVASETAAWGNSVGTLTFKNYIELEFDFTVTATKGWWTNVFRIGNDDNTRLPGAYMAPNAEYMNIHQTLYYSSYTSWYPNDNNPSISLTSSSMVGSHHFYMAISPNKIVVTFDGNTQTWAGSFDRSNYVGTTQNIYFADNAFDSANVVFSNICVRTSSSSLLSDSSSATTTTSSSPVSSSSSLPSQLGFDLSVGLQDDPLSASEIVEVTTSSLLNGVRYYKFYGWDTDHDIAAAIIAKNNDARIYIEILPGLVNDLTSTQVASFVETWDDLSNYIYCIALGNEPLLNNINMDVLPTKLNLVYSEIRSHSGWENVMVSIPFSQNIFDVTYPVPDSTFKSSYKSVLSSIIGIYKTYGAPFSINIYPFFVAPYLPDLMDYILGEASAAGDYSSMLGAQYMATYYAMENVYGNNGVEIVVTETGWSTYSSTYDFATTSNANKYYQNTLRLMEDSTSEIYNKRIYFFELFDESKKGGGDWEQHFGVYSETGSLKLDISGSAFTAEDEGTSTYNATEIALIVIAILLIITCCSVAVYFKYGRNKDSVTFDHSDIKVNETPVTNKEETTNDNNKTEYDIEEIEVDMEIETNE
eukprot:CAMPEP_0201572134 /NCGR_PEP_ID=MMETSP0190_2-20130828/15232_1 /ASSEMBLY_ACC=CAM_ASM_000263 /TAXON_ID=37353 /ORGANISM="Rosalina sp." /LENGTH=618 /DNA_ID=CAMNT_0047997517 /DNA_START=29 /DNA_END=1885 /DNA_ORIENTATION=-